MINQKIIKKFAFEFLTIFIGIFAAFALDSWNEIRKDKNTEIKILSEINKGLRQDVRDISLNETGHQNGLKAATYFRNIVENNTVSKDSLAQKYFYLFRDFISVQNVSGYETLKSKGLEIVKNDSLRSEIISLYENDYNTIRKLEEDYSELQFHENYFKECNNILALNFVLNANGAIIDLKYPIILSEKEKKILLIDLWKIERNRIFMLKTYEEAKYKIAKLQKKIEIELNQ